MRTLTGPDREWDNSQAQTRPQLSELARLSRFRGLRFLANRRLEYVTRRSMMWAWCESWFRIETKVGTCDLNHFPCLVTPVRMLSSWPLYSRNGAARRQFKKSASQVQGDRGS